MGKTRTRSAAPGVTLDAGALIALDRGDRRMIALLERALSRHSRFRIPAGVLGQAWRDGNRQATLARFLRTDAVHVVSLDEHSSRACGELCARSRTHDVIDASVALVAREHNDVIVTSDPDDLRRLDPKAAIVRV